MTETLAAKQAHLLDILRSMKRVIVAFSGGVDSSVVAQAAFLAVGDGALAVTADSPSVARRELADARSVAASIGIAHRVVGTDEFSRAGYRANAGDRCYYCKTELYTVVQSLAAELGGGTVVSGANVDDLGDYRPGLTAAAEHAVRHPLVEAGITKAEVRELAQLYKLAVWDKPASPCLSSRLAPGLEVTPERTGRVERAEAYLKDLGVGVCRVRYHDGDLARVELTPADLPRFLDDGERGRLVAYLQSLGFRYVTLDLAGFESGSLNRLVDLSVIRRYS